MSTNRLFCALWGAALALFAAKAAGVPVWRDGFDIGDQIDCAMTAFFFVWTGLGFIAETLGRRERSDSKETSR